MLAANEQELIIEVRRGSNEAFRVLVQTHMKHAYDIVYSILGDHDDADDVTQEVFVSVYRSFPKFRGESEFGTWLFRIVKNCALNRLKQEKKIQRREVELADLKMRTLVTSNSSCVEQNDHYTARQYFHGQVYVLVECVDLSP